MGLVPWRLAVIFLGILSFHAFPISEQASNYTFMKNARLAPLVSFYDYIIVGGGTAGCALAATLSKNFRVLVLERGGSPYGNANISNMAGFADILSDFSPDSPSQFFVSEDGISNNRARVLGGGSCINAGFYTRASPRYVKTAGWDAALVKRSYEWVEQKLVYEPLVLQWQSALRDGLLEAGVIPYNGYTFDHIVGTKVGGTIFDHEGHRHSAADLLQYGNPARLTVLLRATVQKVLFTNEPVPQRPKANGVVFNDTAGLQHWAFLNLGPKNEIILSAGALGSPQLLMLSGVGPAEHLQSMGIQVVLDQPMVGKGMADNPMNAVFVPSPKKVEISLVQVVGITSFGSYIEGISGIRAAPTDNAARKNTSAGNVGMSSLEEGPLQPLPSKQRMPHDASTMAVEATNTTGSDTTHGGFIFEKVKGPLSTGYLELRNRDPSDNPRVTFNYFQEPEDLRRCVKGLRTIVRLLESKAFAEFRYPGLSVVQLFNITASSLGRPFLGNDSFSLERYCLDTVLTIWHYHGGCQVGRVVGHDYRVLGIDALRVIDGSTFNYSPGTNPQATVMMLGRYMGIQITKERLGKFVD